MSNLGTIGPPAPEGVQLVTATEIAAKLGLKHRGELTTLKARYRNSPHPFPQSVVTYTDYSVRYDAAQIDAWNRARLTWRPDRYQDPVDVSELADWKLREVLVLTQLGQDLVAGDIGPARPAQYPGELIYEMRLRGATLQDIADVIGGAAERVGQIWTSIETSGMKVFQRPPAPRIPPKVEPPTFFETDLHMLEHAADTLASDMSRPRPKAAERLRELAHRIAPVAAPLTR